MPEAKVKIKGPSRLRVLVGSTYIAIGGMLMNYGEWIIQRGIRVEDRADG